MGLPADWSLQFSRSNGFINAPTDIRAICPHCKNASTFITRAQHARRTGSLDEVHLVIECNYTNCKKIVYVRTGVGFAVNSPQSGNEFFMYPSGAIDEPHPSIPPSIAEDWIEAQRTMQASAPKATAVMFRRVLYGVLIDKNCKLHPLHEGLKQLIQDQRLPSIFDEWLPAIKDDGHDGAHPDRALQVSDENVAETLEYTFELLRFLYIEPYEFAQRKLRNALPKEAAAKPAIAAPAS